MSDQAPVGGEEAAESSGVPYEEVTDPAFAEAGAAFESIAITGGISLRGACPRCQDAMEYTWVDDVVRSTSRITAYQRVVTVICTCVVAHQGRTADSKGCGAYWTLRVED
jgi:hypothetical protein